MSAKIAGWGLMRDGRLEPLFSQTKQSMLIGFDMMSLMGLGRMERRLIKSGRVPTRCCMVECDDGDFWTATQNGSFVCADERGRRMTLAEWGSPCETQDDALRRAAGYFLNHEYWLWPRPRGKRDAKRAEKIRADAEQKLSAIGVRLVKAKLVAQ